MFVQEKFYENIKVDLSLRLFSNYLYMPYLKHMKSNPEELSRNVTLNCGAMTIYLDHISRLIREIVAVFVILLLLIWVSPIAIIGVFLFMASLVFFYLSKIKPKIDKKSTRNTQIVKENLKSINEVFGSIKDLKVLMKEGEIFNEFKKNISNFEKNLFFFHIFERLPRIAIELISILLLSIIAIFLIGSNQSYQYFLPILSLITVSVFRFIPAFLSINSAKYYISLLTPNLINLSTSITSFKERNVKNNEVKNINYPIFSKELENKFISLKNVSFSYPGSDTSPLRRVTLDIEKNKIIGITGQTGAGKSTLFYIMLGLLEPTEGAVYNYGKNIHVDNQMWRKKLGYISQNIFLFDSTIEKNITFDFSNEYTNKQKLKSVLKYAQLKEKIEKMPDGLQTIVGNNGIRLSGGERQRVAISRALYQDTEILFLDEFTSALDNQTEKLVMNEIIKNFKDKTIILIAHRKSLLDYCDVIWELESGQLRGVNKK